MKKTSDNRGSDCIYKMSESQKWCVQSCVLINTDTIHFNPRPLLKLEVYTKMSEQM